MAFVNKYRIVTDQFLGYEVQIKVWYFPGWWQVGINSFREMEGAEKYVEELKTPKFKRKVIKYL